MTIKQFDACFSALLDEARGITVFEPRKDEVHFQDFVERVQNLCREMTTQELKALQQKYSKPKFWNLILSARETAIIRELRNRGAR